MSNINRRGFLTFASAAFPGVTFRAPQPLLRRRDQPNILVIMTDQHNASVLGCAGNPIAITPNLDRLAAGGVIFDNHYCNSPLCAPSRLSFTSGKYISRINAWDNSSWLPSDDFPTLPRILNQAGYDTALIGKMHYDYTRRYGFKSLRSIENYDYFDNKSKTGNEWNRKKADQLQSKLVISNRFGRRMFGIRESSPVLEHDKRVTELTTQFLRRRQRGHNPFFLVAGYVAPHYPYVVPKQYWQNFEGRVPMPVIPQSHLESLPLNYKHLRINSQVDNLPDVITLRGRELYFGLTQWFDQEVGKVLDVLRASEVADNTLVIYTSDHGENMGEHGLWFKNCMFEHSARVPLIISWPQRWAVGQRRPNACSLVDVVQTIAALARAEVPEDWNGHSMLDWLDKSTAPWKDRAVSQYYAGNVASGYAMLRAGQYKYVYHAPPEENYPAEQELYDLTNDPGEFINLAVRSAWKDKVEGMHRSLVAEIGEEPDETELRNRKDLATGYNRKESELVYREIPYEPRSRRLLK